ncbi:predicted protein [Sclerotinia sclerotiorum 1980 UF-70]|uniref:Uncharacterized protein n=1 Tax=Sclerotinia sclerotiorum (strain ATCC 18683 / 1980 / Ss-1) TaxID=665079 RepID=A7EFL8_SCLS1|nr:predicted protein [Sclerotinia sclerotiorum 1980 UF-70]EDO01634.1 predicted protein [Sclerotinia sclerotiorum 1980 UF-70]
MDFMNKIFTRFHHIRTRQMSVRKASLNVAEIKRSSGQQGRTDADLELKIRWSLDIRDASASGQDLQAVWGLFRSHQNCTDPSDQDLKVPVGD